MEKYQSRTVDELGRVVIPFDFRKKLGLKAGDSISLTHTSTEVTMQRAEGNTEPNRALCQVDELGRVGLPANIRQQMGWKERAKIAMHHNDNVIILKSA